MPLMPDTNLEMFKEKCVKLCHQNGSGKIAQWMKVTGLKASEQDRLDILEKIANSEIMVAGYNFSNSLKKVPAFHEMEDPELEEKASNAVRIIDARADKRRKFQN